jgi:hypothetical protein
VLTICCLSLFIVGIDVTIVNVALPSLHLGLAGERDHVLAALPGTRSLVSLVVQMNRDDVRTPARSVANQELLRAGETINDAARTVVRALGGAGHRALDPSATKPLPATLRLCYG